MARPAKIRLVFTPIGCAVLIITVIMLVRSLINRNAYEIVLSSAALFLLLVLGVIGLWKSRKLKLLEPGWKPPYPMIANAGYDEQRHTLITGLFGSIPLFFRLHFVIKGRFFPGSLKGFPMLVETSVPRGDTSVKLPLDFPMAGIFQGNGFCQLRDIFGFFSFNCGLPQQKTINVRSLPCFGRKTYINAQTGAEDQRNKPAADIERYYMREYTPGDRFRDINWKSSEKLDNLITRISTDNQEKVSRIEVYFRNFGPVDSDNNRERRSSLDALWLLDRAKARLSYFLRSLMEQNSSFIFDVRAAEGSWEIQNLNELDAFLEELAGLTFSSPQNETTQTGAGEIFVFSTACDTILPFFISACNPRPVSLFLVQPARQGSKTKEQREEIETLLIGDFLQKGCVPSLRMLRKNTKWLNANSSNGRVEMFYADTAFIRRIKFNTLKLQAAGRHTESRL
ncbi:MAG: DUF58 domain-containing protein [Treponema sp.]|nr:DUF58 domain-containing protein [Treponema sp.]